MIIKHDIDEKVAKIADRPEIAVGFVVSSHGKIESLFPASSEKFVTQWMVVLTPLFQLMEGMERYRFSRIQYREGELLFFRLSATSRLVLVVKPDQDFRSLFDQIYPEVKKLEGIRATQHEDDTDLDHGLQSLLFEASDHLKNEFRNESEFFGALRKMTFLYFGALGEEWADQSLEGLWLTLPIRQRHPMEALVKEIKKRISHPIKRLAFERDSGVLINQFIEK